MSENIQTALVLLAVGMITVFVILSLVVLTGKVLVRIINGIHKEEKGPVFIHKARRNKTRGGLNKAKLAAIIAAVDIATAGQGRIEKIEKVGSNQ